jgi:hypothetical protein
MTKQSNKVRALSGVEVDLEACRPFFAAKNAALARRSAAYGNLFRCAIRARMNTSHEAHARVVAAIAEVQAADRANNEATAALDAHLTAALHAQQTGGPK